jgi:hypothetical protein
MEARQFDGLTKALISGTNRRSVLGGLVGGLVAALGAQRATVADECKKVGQKVKDKKECCSGAVDADGRCVEGPDCESNPCACVQTCDCTAETCPAPCACEVNVAGDEFCKDGGCTACETCTGDASCTGNASCTGVGRCVSNPDTNALCGPGAYCIYYAPCSF